MLITFEELRTVKHNLPTGSIKQIAQQLNVKEQTVRNYFGAQKTSGQLAIGWHKQTGPKGGILKIEDPTILNLAKQIILEVNKETK